MKCFLLLSVVMLLPVSCILGIIVSPKKESFVPRLVRQADDTDYYSDESTDELNPCELVLPTLPDFKAPGRRISDVKCFEYIWDIKAREDKRNKDEDCRQYMYTHYNAGYGRGTGVGGRSASKGEFPHMGAIGWKAVIDGWIFKCGGSLISEKYVLTAAHCSRASGLDNTVTDIHPKIVRFADNFILDKDETGHSVAHVDRKILKFIQHPKYTAPKKYNDIAIIELDRTVQFDRNTQPACLYTGSDEKLVGLRSTMTGWGVVETVNHTTSPILQAVDVDVIASDECDKLLRIACNRNWCGLVDSQICAGKLAGGADACQGDSGGPLQIEIQLPQQTRDACPEEICRRMHKIIGVTSFGVGCALPNLPGVYTRVASHLDWIEEIVWK